MTVARLRAIPTCTIPAQCQGSASSSGVLRSAVAETVRAIARAARWLARRAAQVTNRSLVAVAAALLAMAHVGPALASRADRPAGQRVVAVLERVSRSLRETRYQAKTIVNARRGIYRWDCSGMTAWVLSRSAPRAVGTIGIRRPRARDFARAIAAAPVRGGRGWRRVQRVAQVLPGDVFAWERGGGRAPEAFLRALAERHLRRRPYVTGHVAATLEAPPVASLSAATECYTPMSVSPLLSGIIS